MSFGSGRLSLRYALEFLVLGLQCLLLRLNLGLNGSIELRREIKIGDGQVCDADSVLDPFFLERVVDVGDQTLLDLELDDLAFRYQSSAVNFAVTDLTHS